MNALDQRVPDGDKFVSVIEEYRRVRLLKAEQLLSRYSPSTTSEIDELGGAFAQAHEAYPGLSVWIYINEVETPRGPGSLEFRELARRAVSAFTGESDWRTWLEMLLAYLLNNDSQQEFLGTFSCGHLDRPEGTTPETHPGTLIEGENYHIAHLFKVSQHCCTWLKWRSRSASRSAPAYGECADNRDAPTNEKGSLGRPETRPSSATAVGGATPATNRLQQAMADRGLNVPRLTRKICAALKRQGVRKTSVDRTTVYRLLTGGIKKTTPSIWSAVVAVLNLPGDATIESMTRPIEK